MPPISDNKTSGSAGGLAGLPDRDNPFAWKRKTLEGKRGARDLLGVLTDDEVARYMLVARDQMRLEERWVVAKVLSALGALVLLLAIGWHMFGSGLTRWDIAGLGLAFVMGYWPWRVLKCRQLWHKHFEAARAEQARRNTAA